MICKSDFVHEQIVNVADTRRDQCLSEALGTSPKATRDFAKIVVIKRMSSVHHSQISA